MLEKLKRLFGRRSRRRRGRVASRTYSGVELDFNAIPTFEWSLDLCVGAEIVAETHSPSPLALLALVEEIRTEYGLPLPPAALRLRHLSSGDQTTLRPSGESADPVEVVRRARPSYRQRSIDDTATRTTLTRPDGEATTLADAMATLRAATAPAAGDR